eukprot:4832633-Amphidinium_carterae.1
MTWHFMLALHAGTPVMLRRSLESGMSCEHQLPNSLHGRVCCAHVRQASTNSFWQMVWENGCTIIVMLTDLEEGSQDIRPPQETQTQNGEVS